MENQISVLLIEDNPGDTRLMQELFREAKGISVCLLCADRLSSGLKQISDGGVDIVLLDLSLPDSKGFDTFTKLHAQAKDLPVILLTGLDDEELVMRAVREGAQDYMVKGSVTSQALARAVRFAVERHKTLGAWVPLWVGGPCRNPECEAYVEEGTETDEDHGGKPTAKKS